MAERVEQVQRAFTAYAIERELGAGGMATVYLAHDKKHDRKVAIKILHAELAAMLGAERFLQEIKLAANLQHPHILGLIDSGVIGDDADELSGRPYYVMPFVEGESLRERLRKEQQLPVSDAVRVATEVASALDYAHRHGVIHRDIKPENLLLHDGSAIVADFGIALAVTQAGGHRITQSGVSLGTPSYMSPEQAMGERTITARSDIYSLGTVTYEMLSGEPPFTGPTAQAIVARIMTEEPRSLRAQRRNVPPHVEAAVIRALEKVPADRFSSAREFAEALDNPSLTLPSAVRTRVERDRSRHRSRILYALTGIAILTTGAAILSWMRPAPSKAVLRYSLALDSTEAIVPGADFWTRVALSPDGSRLAYIGGAHAQLMIRVRNQLHATAVPGTEGAYTPFFSPDGNHIGLLREKKIEIVSINGGQPVELSDSMVGVAGASWGPDGFIYADGAGYISLVRIEAKPGAVAKLFTTLDTAKGEVDHLWPDVLPNGKGVVFTVKTLGNGGTRYSIGVAEIPSGKHRILVDDAMYARYAKSGELLYITTNKTLMAAPFDQNSMKVKGEPTALVEGLRLGAFGSADLAVSDAGTLVYATGAGQDKQELVWVSRDGKVQSIDPDWQAKLSSPALSPDGKQLAIARRINGQRTDIWIKQLDRGPSTKLSLDGNFNNWPTWTADGKSVTFSSDAGGSVLRLWTKRADGTTQAVMQLNEKRDIFQSAWSSDGKWLVYSTDVAAFGEGDILGFRPGIDAAPQPLMATKFIESAPALSPDGRWLAYTSNESGDYENYVVPFPNTGAAKWVVSTHGGMEPMWSHSGRELFYRDGARNLVAVRVKTTPTFSLGLTSVLFPAGGFNYSEVLRQYDVSPDDRRFLMIRPVAADASANLIVVENWFDELRAKSRK